MRRRLDHGAALARIVDLAEAPREGALVVIGEPGIGKTHLLEAAHATLGEAGVLVRANPAERSYALSGFSALSAAMHDSRAVEFGGRFSLPPGDDGRIFAAAHDVLGVLRGLRLPPTVVLIDDADGMDQESRLLLGLMAERLAGTGLRFVLASRELAPRSPFGGTEAIELAPLELAAAMDRGHELAGVDDSTLRMLALLSAGNPAELRRQLDGADDEVLAGRTGLPMPLQPKTELPVDAQRVLRGLGAAEQALLQDIALAPLLHLGVLDAGSGALDDLMTAGLLIVRGSTVRFREPRLRAHVFWSTNGRLRRQRHQELAALHAELDPRLAVWHRSQDEMGPGTGEELLRAAIGYAEEGECEAAAEFAERAVRLAAPQSGADALLVDLAERLVLHGELEAANRYLGFVRHEHADAAQATRTAMVRLGAGTLSGQPPSDGEIVAIAMVHGDEAPDGAVALLAAAAALRAERWELVPSRALLAQAEGLADRAVEPVRRLLRTATEMVDAHDGRPATAVGVDRDLLQQPTLALLHARALIWSEDHPTARLLLASLMAFPRSGEPLWAETARMLSVDNEIAAGDFRVARALLDAPTALRAAPGGALQALMIAWRRVTMGDPDATPALEAAILLADQEQQPALQARAAALRASHALLQDDPEETLRQGLALGRLRRHGGPEHQLRHVGDSVDAALRLGMPSRAAEEVAAFRQRHARRPSRWGALLLQRMRAQMQQGAASLPQFAAAVEAFGPGDSPFELGRTQLAFAERLEQLGMAQEAGAARAAAVAAFDGAGAEAWAARAAGTASVDPPVEAAARLSAEELEIVRMVQAGARNRQIAEALFLSVRTVEQRLTRIYRTLGIASRAQLGTALGVSRLGA